MKKKKKNFENSFEFVSCGCKFCTFGILLAFHPRSSHEEEIKSGTGSYGDRSGVQRIAYKGKGKSETFPVLKYIPYSP